MAYQQWDPYGTFACPPPPPPPGPSPRGPPPAYSYYNPDRLVPSPRDPTLLAHAARPLGEHSRMVHSSRDHRDTLTSNDRGRGSAHASTRTYRSEVLPDRYLIDSPSNRRPSAPTRAPTSQQMRVPQRPLETVPPARDLLTYDRSDLGPFYSRLDEDRQVLRNSRLVLSTEYAKYGSGENKVVHHFIKDLLSCMSAVMAKADSDLSAPFDALSTSRWTSENGRQFCYSIGKTQTNLTLQEAVVDAYVGMANFGMPENRRLDSAMPFILIETVAMQERDTIDKTLKSYLQAIDDPSELRGLYSDRAEWTNLLDHVGRARAALRIESKADPDLVLPEDAFLTAGSHGKFWWK